MVQWLRLRAPNAGGPGSLPGQGTRSHMTQLRVRTPQLKIPRATTKIRCSQKRNWSGGSGIPREGKGMSTCTERSISCVLCGNKGTVSNSCSNKSPQIWWLQATEFFFYHSSGDLKSEISITGLKPRCQQGHTPVRGSKGKPFPSLFWVWCLLVFLTLWQRHSSYLCPLPQCLPSSPYDT